MVIQRGSGRAGLNSALVSVCLGSLGVPCVLGTEARLLCWLLEPLTCGLWLPILVSFPYSPYPSIFPLLSLALFSWLAFLLLTCIQFIIPLGLCSCHFSTLAWNALPPALCPVVLILWSQKTLFVSHLFHEAFPAAPILFFFFSGIPVALSLCYTVQLFVLSFVIIISLTGV